jgi:hypothetical protein
VNYFIRGQSVFNGSTLKLPSLDHAPQFPFTLTWLPSHSKQTTSLRSTIGMMKCWICKNGEMGYWGNGKKVFFLLKVLTDN